MPTTEKITHIVVDNGMSPGTGYLVSVHYIVTSTPEVIHLNCTKKVVSKMPVFDREMFLPSDFAGETGRSMIWPFFSPMANYIMVEEQYIPMNELAIRRGAQVKATDGNVGRVDEFLINPYNEHITHLVMREGHLWGQKDVTIPVDMIDHYQKNMVFLKLDKHGIKALPAIPIRRGSSRKNNP